MSGTQTTVKQKGGGVQRPNQKQGRGYSVTLHLYSLASGGGGLWPAPSGPPLRCRDPTVANHTRWQSLSTQCTQAAQGTQHRVKRSGSRL
jgi:hypothetical protein